MVSWLAPLPLWWYLALCGGWVAIGLWIAGKAEHYLQCQDAAPIVIDEIAGVLLAYCAVPLSFWTVVLGFISFRVFDIAKPWPQLERLPGGWGIMSDDLAAGLLAQGCLRLGLLVFSP